MPDFDLSALEKALSSKGRQPRQSLSLSPALSKSELYDEAKKLADEYHNVYRKKLRVRHQGDSYGLEYGHLYRNRRQVGDIEQVPRTVFEKLIANGRHYLKDYHDMINTVIIQNPTLALEANLEGRTGSAVLDFAYSRRIDQIDKLLASRVSSPVAKLYLNFDGIEIKPLLGNPFSITVSAWSKRPPSVDGVDPYAKSPVGMARLVSFINCFEQVIAEINRRIDEIEIRR